MASASTVVQATGAIDDHAPTAAKTGVEQRGDVAGSSHIPRSLLHSPSHSAMAVVVWATYESLMPRAMGGGRVAARARRCWVGDKYRIGERAVDDARRELLADVDGGGPWLRRSAPQGSKRASRHMALRLPEQTRAGYAEVPSWTLELVDGSRRRQPGRISPDAWRLYARGVDRTGKDGGSFETRVLDLGKWLDASPDTGRRRLHELERAGLFEVTERAGGWLIVQAHVLPERVLDTANRYAAQGRAQTKPRRDPWQRTPLTPGNELHSPLATNSTPQETALQQTTFKEPPLPPAVGELPVVDDAREAADAAESTDARSEKPAAAPRLYRLLPERLRARVPEHGSRRVLHAIADELTHRTAGELAERITRRGQAWAYRVEDVKDATAVATTIVRRGYDCPDIRCEDHHRIDTSQPCTHCEALTASQTPAQAPGGQSPQPHPQRPPQTPQTPYKAPRSRPLDDAAYRAKAAEARAMLRRTLAG